MNDLEMRLGDLGRHLAVDDADVVDGVLARLDDEEASGVRQREVSTWLRAAAVVLVLAAAVALAVPDSRRAIADWFGLGGVRIEREPGLTVPATAPPIDGAAPIGDAEIVAIDGVDVMVSAIDGTLEPDLLTKTVGAGTSAVAVDVDGAPGVWIDGAPHIVAYRTDEGTPATVRVAGNTLLWQDGAVIRRAEGFVTLDDALEYATR